MGNRLWRGEILAKYLATRCVGWTRNFDGPASSTPL
jgi:hypothetical protein